ncbi:hypothetical protein E1B28_001980 [Marasmius oreades]|uniref:EthD domain-containing protein n=1 Tax=Marasmius oreades TaxID=181124 RepID=A0A9P7V4M4_9AGAR|nr:uncharacterized protein E1B28_001980 [Marasmius oreades]KAG7100205.1 hypothetical protein E1B28_001980 [Marasmius oreades]
MMADPPNKSLLNNQRVRVLIFVQKKDDVPFEEWSRYWRDVHSKIFMDLEITKKNILKYEQLHVNQEWKERLAESHWNLGNSRLRVPDYDGVVVFEGESLEKITEVIQHPEYVEKVVGDGLSKLFKADTIVQGAFDIATIHESPNDHSGDDVKLPKVPGMSGNTVLLTLIRKKDGLSQAEFIHYWLNVHAPLVKPSLATTLQLIKHEQLHAHQGSVLQNTTGWDGIAVTVQGESLTHVLSEFQKYDNLETMTDNCDNFHHNYKQFEVLPCDAMTFIDR